MKHILTAAALAFTTLVSVAQTAEEKGLQIATDGDKIDQGFKNSIVELTMTLTNRQGQQTTRYMRTKTLEQIVDGDKSLIVFDSPKDVKGTATLTYTHKEGDDDQWLYLPALSRVKRISSSNKSGPFMGSEFAYEDLSSQEVEKYTYKYIKDDTKNGEDCYVVERYPVDPKSGYKKQISYINKANYRPEEITFFDRRGSKLKTMTYTGYQKYAGKHWRADKMTVVNHQTGKKTELMFKNYAFKTSLTAKDFNQASLARAGR